MYKLQAESSPEFIKEMQVVLRHLSQATAGLYLGNPQKMRVLPMWSH